jgi:pantoate--beta-alanine ligase
LQFGPNEDFDDYPRTFEDDCKHLTSAGVAVLFYPGVDEIYPEGMENHSTVTVPNLTDLHCGAARPGHFDGVTTVVMKLLNMVRPKVALFGKKDYQQLAVIRKMADDFCLPVSIFGVDTCREASGLALSSRNQYLTPEERAIAPQLNRHLRSLASRMQAGEECRTALENTLAALKALGFSVDYLSLADSKTLIPVPTPVTGQSLVLLVAAKLGKTRLIDNLEWICP